MAQQRLYVDSARGQDRPAGGSASQPLKTVTAALQQASTDVIIHVSAGLYTASTGEQFPLKLPPGCQVVGERTGDRPATLFQGSGLSQHPLLGTLSVTCILSSDVQLQQVTILNPEPQGIGLWLAAGRSQLHQVAVLKCRRYGIVVTGNALPTIADSWLEECGLAGLACFTQSKGQITRLRCRINGTGILIQNSAAPLLQACQIEGNETGVAIADTANPVLRRNRITGNRTYGIHLQGNATADIGQPQDYGQNLVRNNEQADIYNRTPRSLRSCGNDVLPQRLQGPIELVAGELPDLSAVPSSLFEQPTQLPPPSEAPPAPEEPPMPAGSHRFRDLAHHWAGPFVDGLVQAGAVAGFEDGTFRPNEWVTRAQFAALVVASFPDRPDRIAPVPFRDVPRDFWAWTVLMKAQRLGFLTGFPDRTMRPNLPITRIQAIVAMTNGLGLTGGRVDDIGIYRDRAQIPSYAVDALATATQQRLVVNYPEPLQLRPLESITRAETAAVIYQGRVAISLSPAIASPYIVRPDTTQPLFSDLSGHWADEFIRGLAQANLVSGLSDGSFAPSSPMNRAQFAALVVNAFQPAPQRAATVFSDVPSRFWGAEAIQAAYRGGFMSGFPDRTFGPQNPLLRVQVWVALVNGLGWENAAVDLNPLGRFRDYTTLPRYALRSTAIAAARQLIANYPDPNVLHPNQVATRAEVCVAVYQALVALQRLPAIASAYVV